MSTIESCLNSLRPAPLSISFSILHHSITVRHSAPLSAGQIWSALEDDGFEVYTAITDSTHDGRMIYGTTSQVLESSTSGRSGLFEQAVAGYQLRRTTSHQSGSQDGWEKHLARCRQCRAEVDHGAAKRSADPIPPAHPGQHDDRKAQSGPFVTIEPAHRLKKRQLTLSIEGMTCGSCVGIISGALNAMTCVDSVDVSLITSSALVTFEGSDQVAAIVGAIEDLGYEAKVDKVESVQSNFSQDDLVGNGRWRATFAIGGMTCSSCVNNITDVLKQNSWIETVDVLLPAGSATVTFWDRSHLDEIQAAIEAAGYEATLDQIIDLEQDAVQRHQRTVALRVWGMHCNYCPSRIEQALVDAFQERVTIVKVPTHEDPILEIGYDAHPPDFTIRHIIACIAAADPAFSTTINHPPTLEERAQKMHLQEQGRILRRTLLAIAVALPTFVIGIVFMSLVPKRNSGRQYLMRSMGLGSASRADWALFILASPVYFFAADIFHLRALKEIRALWRPRSTTPILRRFYRFGSMNLLISLGTTLAYFSSLAELAISAATTDMVRARPGRSNYFDSVVFLTMFLLLGRLLEAYSKAKTGDAVAALGKLRPSEAILVTVGLNGGGGMQDGPYSELVRVQADLLEVGDIVRVLQGGSPPMDGIIVSGTSKFDESALTGEAKAVKKNVGSSVFSGTINKGQPITIRVTTTSGVSMLDQIVALVRQGQARRAPIERVADVITGYFVPVVTLAAILTWVVWLALGLSDVLPDSFGDTHVGGWPFWSLQFAIAVFVVACPCGIGLAAPTALFVGGGLAAQHGILANAGGEAFQEASKLDCIVLDKTGTITQGGEPAVTDCRFLLPGNETEMFGVMKTLEENSSHPVARAVVRFCSSKDFQQIQHTSMEEIAGKGLRGSFNRSVADDGDTNIDVLLGNEALLNDHRVEISDEIAIILDSWKCQGRSVVLLAVKGLLDLPVDRTQQDRWHLSAVLAVSDPVRPEAAAVIAAIKRKGIDVWMVSGDNPQTASAIGCMVGIPPENIIAGVLPEQKADKIKYLQRGPPKSRHSANHRAVVAMVGDGINDAPALTAADVGIAIGSGSDAAISSAKFVLLRSDLTSLLTLIDLSRVVLGRVKFNFFWALIYNIIAVPIAAGVLYPVKSQGAHIRLDPVWASLAMALSSISVICSSLLLRTKIPVLGFRATGDSN